MGFFLGFFFGIGAGVAFSEFGLNYPLDYESKPDGFGKVTVNLEVLNPVYKTYSQAKSYLKAASNKIMPAPRTTQSQLISETVSKTVQSQTDAVI